MDRKQIAQETLDILNRGWYDGPAGRVEIREKHRASVAGSRFFPAEAAPPLPDKEQEKDTKIALWDCSTVGAVLRLAGEGVEKIGVLNFASAKNPGGGFLNGAMAQEESLAASGGLYQTLTPHQEYYRRNRGCSNMSYTDCAIYSPEVVFFRDEDFSLLERPVTASVLTLPAVNLGQVMQKGEDLLAAKETMRRRMGRALELFGGMGDRTLVLGAYGCGVFRNDPREVALRWEELFQQPEMKNRFDRVVFAVLDRSRRGDCWRAFQERFGEISEK